MVSCTYPACAGLTAPEMTGFSPSFKMVGETFSVSLTFTCTSSVSLVEALSLEA
jgi:hypothetical protein